MSWWTCIKGAAQYLVGAERSELGQQYAAQQCAKCPSLTRYREESLSGLPKIGAKFFSKSKQPLTGWCGEPGMQADWTCGCLVLAQDPNGVKMAHATITVNGEQVGMSAAGKTTRSAQYCPQGKWMNEGFEP